MSAEDWGPCPACKTPLSRANASRLRSGAVMHVGCKGLQKEPSEPVGIVVTAPRGFPAELREEIALGQAAKYPGKLAPVKQRRRISLVEMALATGPAKLDPELIQDSEELHRGLADEVARVAAEPKEDVVLQALHVAGGANGIGVGEVRPEATPLACEACWMPVALCACACASCGGMCGARCLSGGPGKATRPAPAPDLIRSIIESGRVSGARALLDRLPDHPALRGWREVLAPPVVRTSTGTRPNIDVRSPAGVVPAEPDGTLLRVLVGRDEAGKLAVTELGPDGAEAARVGEWDPAGPFGDGKLIYSKREGLRGVLALLAWCFRLWDSEVVTLAPLAKAEPPAAPEPVHMLVPGFPGHACCGQEVEAPKPAVPPSRGKRARDGKPAVPASPGSPAVPGAPVAPDRPKATCPECLEVYDCAERLASRIEELRGEDEPEPCDCEDEDAWEEVIRKKRDEEQLAMVEAGAPPAPAAERPAGELVHLFDGFPHVKPRPRRSGPEYVETRCGIATSRKFEALTSGKVELFAVPFLAGHPRCCPACAALPQPPNARSYGAFVPLDCVVGGGKIGA